MPLTHSLLVFSFIGLKHAALISMELPHKSSPAQKRVLLDRHISVAMPNIRKEAGDAQKKIHGIPTPAEDMEGLEWAPCAVDSLKKFGDNAISGVSSPVQKHKEGESSFSLQSSFEAMPRKISRTELAIPLRNSSETELKRIFSKEVRGTNSGQVKRATANQDESGPS